MPGLAQFHTDEHDLLLGYLDQERAVLHLTAYGLTDAQARTAAAAPSPLSIGGLIKHCALVERNWVDVVLGRDRAADAESDYADSFVMHDDETLAGLFVDALATAEETARVIRGIGDLDRPVAVPRGVPWYPQDIDAWSVRWVLLHLVAETARHAGHADIVREALDGATAFPLMAAAEGWPETPWMQPWSPT
jgi:hypothetical protein